MFWREALLKRRWLAILHCTLFSGNLGHWERSKKQEPTRGFCRRMFSPWLVWLSGLSAGLRSKGSLVQFPVSTRTWVTGPVTSRRPRIDVSLPLFLSLLSPLSKY